MCMYVCIYIYIYIYIYIGRTLGVQRSWAKGIWRTPRPVQTRTSICAIPIECADIQPHQKSGVAIIPAKSEFELAGLVNERREGHHIKLHPEPHAKRMYGGHAADDDDDDDDDDNSEPVQHHQTA